MKSYRIESEAGVAMGTYSGETPEEAVRAMNLDAGYKTDAEALEVTGNVSIMDGLIVKEVAA